MSPEPLQRLAAVAVYGWAWLHWQSLFLEALPLAGGLATTAASAVLLGPILWTVPSGHRQAFFWILAALWASDWIDGKLAILLDQRTTFGARLDSAADGLMYLAIALSFWWLEGGAIRRS